MNSLQLITETVSNPLFYASLTSAVSTVAIVRGKIAERVLNGLKDKKIKKQLKSNDIHITDSGISNLTDEHNDTDNQMDIFEESEELSSNSSIASNTNDSKKGNDNAVFLRSTYDLTKGLSGASNNVYEHVSRLVLKDNVCECVISLRNQLMKQYRLEALRVFLIDQAEEKDLIDAMKNPNIHHVIVHGHGSWDSWVDDNGKSINNEHLGCLKDVKKKKSFVRQTCGVPQEEQGYEDQFGTPFAEDIFGKSHITTQNTFKSEPMSKTSKADFDSSRAISEEEHIEIGNRLIEENSQGHGLLKKISQKIEGIFSKNH